MPKVGEKAASHFIPLHTPAWPPTKTMGWGEGVVGSWVLSISGFNSAASDSAPISGSHCSQNTPLVPLPTTNWSIGPLSASRATWFLSAPLKTSESSILLGGGLWGLRCSAAAASTALPVTAISAVLVTAAIWKHYYRGARKDLIWLQKASRLFGMSSLP